MTKLAEVRSNIQERLGQLSPVTAPRATKKTLKKSKRAHSARPSRLHPNKAEYTSDRENRRPSTAGPARAKSGTNRAFPPPSARRKKGNGPGGLPGRSSIAMDMMKLVDGHRPPSSKLQGEPTADISTMNFSSMVANRPGPGPSQYYPDFTIQAHRKSTVASSFGREDRFKHLAGETQPAARYGPGPKYNPSLKHTKTKNPVAKMGREQRLGSGVVP